MKGIGKIIGGVLLLVGLISVFVYKYEHKPPEEPPVIRPLKTVVIGESQADGGHNFPGTVKPVHRVSMSFQVSGALTELKVSEGDHVKKNQLLAELDQRDFMNRLDASKASLKREKALYERTKKAAKSGAVSEQDVTNAQAAYDSAKADVSIKKKALNDTKLFASFDGVIAKKFVKNFEKVNAHQPILSLQDISSIEVDTSIPESWVAGIDPRKLDAFRKKAKAMVHFDFLPGRPFEFKVDSFSTESDPVTQTYTVTFIAPAPEDVSILPGMSAMVNIKLPWKSEEGDKKIHLPMDAATIDGEGQYYVWRVTPDKGNLYKVERQNIVVGEMGGNRIHVKEGLRKGDRVALAGVSILLDDQKVRLLKK